ncbi:hypothetical protein JDO7802_00097 [Jannaschia donghaensis]|uniref:Uncharacterized protein n=1 Tax=Jannaschia donghaensis TaxID=420998 RepID=A0A0M6YEH1_9RHOB|nr:hypothetical protein JDO7802_00097 [Jannaschia donghaensis]
MDVGAPAAGVIRFGGKRHWPLKDGARDARRFVGSVNQSTVIIAWLMRTASA